MTPLWNTQRAFLHDNSVATLKRMGLTGSYKYNLETSSTLTDRLTLDIVGVSPKLYLYGFLIRHFLKIKENYFGEYLHFKTLEEYQGLLATAHTPEESGGMNPSPKTNDLDIFIQVHADNGSIFLPAHIYDRTNCVRIDTVTFDTDLRFTNYYMDMETSFGPAEFVIDSAQPDGSHFSSSTQLFLDGLSIYGHRLFGLPPTEPTYVCNWDFQVGYIVGECTPSFLKYAASAVNFLAFSFDDEENALPPLHPIEIHDVTFVRARVNRIRTWVLVEDSAILFNCGVINLDFNDWADMNFSSRLNLNLPDLILAVVDRNAAIRPREPSRETVKTYGYFQTSLFFRMMERKSDFFVSRGLQQEHIRVHDQRSNRTPWLLHNVENTLAQLSLNTTNHKVSPPAMPVPLMPEPIQSIPKFYEDSSISSSPFPYISSGKSSIRSSRSSGSKRGNFPNFSRVPPHGSDVTDATVASRRQTTHSFDGAQGPNNILSLTNSISSPWAIPNFHFNGIEPDIGGVPTFPNSDDMPERSEWGLGSNITLDSGSKYENATQVFFHYEFKRGLRGLGSPEALSAISSLFDELQPAHPVDIIDNLQAGVISSILAHEKAIAGPKKISNFSLVFPRLHIRFINSSKSMDVDQLGNFRDQYDLKLAHISSTFRTAVESKRGDHVRPPKTDFTMHLAADEVSLSAHGEQMEALDRKGLVHCTLKNIICWSAFEEETQRSHVQIQDIETATSSKSVQDSAFLIDRTTNLVDSIVAPFQKASAAYTRRLRCLVYTLTSHGSQTPDPLFLTRTSYVLRAAQDHLRLHDSWKIISRLRNIYNCLPADQTSKLACDCITNTISCPPDAQTTVLSNFDRWRTWDLSHVKNSAVMKVIWGDLEEGNANSREPANQTFTLNMNRIGFCLDPGPKESRLSLQGFSTSLNLGISPLKQQTAGRLHSRYVAVQTFCSNISLGLKWEICELVEGILEMVSGRQKQTAPPAQVPHDARPAAKTDEIQFVFLVDDGSVVVDGININVSLRGSGIKGSVIHQPSRQDSTSSTSVVVSSDESSVQFSSRLKDLMIWRLMCPNVFVSHTSQVSGARVKHDWKSAAACRRLLYDMNEDPLGMVQVVDRIVEDEVKYIIELISTIESSQSEREIHSTTARKRMIIHRFTLQCFWMITISPKMKPSDHDLIYKVRFTLAGVDIFATAPGLSSKDYSADMNFKVGLVQFHLENASLNGPVLQYPEFNLRLSRISFDLKKRDEVHTNPYGSLLLDAQILGTSKTNDGGDVVRSYDVINKSLQIELYAETAMMIVDIAAHLQERLKTLDLSQEVKHLRRLRLITAPERMSSMETRGEQAETQNLFNAMCSVVLANIQMDKTKRSRNSALLPEAVFNVAYLSNGRERRLAFQAAGKELDIRVTSEFILPARILQDSIALASDSLRKANKLWSAAIPLEKKKTTSSTSIIRLASLLIDADFSGAVVSLQGRQDDGTTSAASTTTRNSRASGGGKYGQYIPQDAETTATLRAPGVALKVHLHLRDLWAQMTLQPSLGGAS
ncbi:fermentation associated protein [Histoplasma capsulatum H143]|uniref:Fermentation associated protein n=1 Tax=Ajellomyces capsulatus (strain H143) TaxID=544712 RepID=C6HE21_AJECH|nr:fermentation associated protein [Histoplasma capsulatum H143]